jgi:hypothetical protein
MMETVYEFVSSGWEDVDLDFPLTYEFLSINSIVFFFFVIIR